MKICMRKRTQSQTAGNNNNTNTNTKNSLNYGNLSPQNRIYQSFCGDFFSIILMVFIIKASRQEGISRRLAFLSSAPVFARGHIFLLFEKAAEMLLCDICLFRKFIIVRTQQLPIGQLLAENPVIQDFQRHKSKICAILPD